MAIWNLSSNKTLKLVDDAAQNADHIIKVNSISTLAMTMQVVNNITSSTVLQYQKLHLYNDAWGYSIIFE